MYCQNCGQQNPDGATICSNCGQPLPASTAPAAPPAPPASPEYQQAAPTYAPPPAPPQQPAYAAPPAGYAPQPNIPTYLWQSIVVTLVCCWPLGIPAIVFASQVNSKLGRGDIAGAQKASKNAKMWTIISLVAGIVGGILYFVFFVLLGIADYASY